MSKAPPTLLLTLCAFAGLVPVASASEPATFERVVKPIFAKYCTSCHGPEKQKGGLRLDRKATALAGGDSGKAIVAGKSAESLLIERVCSDDPNERMPPKGPRPSAANIAALRGWIDAGAHWPDDGSAKANPADWWSFKPVKRPEVPAGREPRRSPDRRQVA